MVRVPTAQIGDKWSVSFNGPEYITKLKGFENLFQEQLRNVTENLLKGGVTVARKTLDSAETEWGRARIRGERFGVRFSPEGNTAGRNKTGFMMNSLDWKLVERQSGRNKVGGKLGWFPENTKGRDGYIRMQEYGFRNISKFNRSETARTGRASFYNDPSRPRWTHGAKSLEAGKRSVDRRAQAAFSAAWNESVRQWYAAGFKTSPGSYKAARGRFARFGRV